jgi:isopentenyldiphosphate isomerase/intracellular septation protein A
MNGKTILKKFSIGFIPLLIFIIADEFFGTKIGIIAAITVGILEFSYYYIKYRQIEKFVLFDVGLIITLGAISLILENDLFFKLKPALIETILLILLGIHAFSNKPLLLLLGKRYLKDLQIDELQIGLMKKITRLIFFIVLFHTALIIYAAYYLSTEAWAFISGGLFYIIFGLVFVGQFVYFKFFKPRLPHFTANDEEEWFDLVTPEGKIIGKAPRSAVHGNPRLLHPVVHLHIFHRNGQIFLQKRSQIKDVQPGKWDTAVGGHVLTGEDVISALKREALEELGIKKDNYVPLYSYIMKNDYESELVYTFRVTDNGPFKINRDEIDLGRFWGIKEIERNLVKNIFTPNFEQEFIMLQKILKQKKKQKS